MLHLFASLRVQNNISHFAMSACLSVQAMLCSASCSAVASGVGQGPQVYKPQILLCKVAIGHSVLFLNVGNSKRQTPYFQKQIG